MSKNRRIILGIETSCDDTGLGIICDGKKVLSNIVSSQINIHKEFGGVVPELASRSHLEVIYAEITKALEEANLTLNDINAVAVTYGPGLVGCLLTGIEVAKSISYVRNIPLIGVNHLEGHVFSSFLENPKIKFPFIGLIVSGGHTELVKVNDFGHYEILGKTRDDACGEAFDKIAKLLGLGYPGGPYIEKLAKDSKKSYKFPEAIMKDGSLDFSFSGLKTAVLNFLQENKNVRQNDLCAGFQNAAISALLNKTIDVAKKLDIKRIVLGGGVIVNKALKKEFKERGEKEEMDIYYPSPIFCTDNGVMIALIGYYKFLRNEFSDWTLNANPALTL
ncbi:MAG: tRNA (adenosine(37)-N6)-threonylcarbamoyltransferase complex transferase subunit TsaD [Candidatus Firestonebacteria bacterium]